MGSNPDSDSTIEDGEISHQEAKRQRRHPPSQSTPAPHVPLDNYGSESEQVLAALGKETRVPDSLTGPEWSVGSTVQGQGEALPISLSVSSRSQLQNDRSIPVIDADSNIHDPRPHPRAASKLWSQAITHEIDMLQAIAITLNGSCILLLTPQAINLNLQKLCLHVGGAQASFQHARPMAMNAGLHFQLREYTIKCLSSVGVLTQEGEAQAAQAAMPLWVICPARVQKEAVEADLEELQRPSNNSILSEIFRIMPRVIFLFNDWFAVREVHDRLDGAIDEALLLTALTLGFVSENNLEQLELLGDVVLEVFSIICETLNTKNRNMCMTIIEAAKERVCNQALYDISKDLIGRIRAIPPTEITKVSPFTNNQEPREQLLSVKDVADSFEAIIGAAWKSSPEFQDTFRAAGNLGMVIQGITSWRQIVDLAPPKGVLSDEAKNKLGALSKLMEPAEAFNEHNAFNFVLCSSGKPQDDLLKHMEHIGTALINLLQVEYDIGRYPDANPGLLTKLKMDGDTLIALCVDSGLSDFIPAGPGSYAITIYSELQQRAKSEYSNIVGRWWEYVEDEPPKTLQVFLRELVAAIFISDNFSLHGRVSEFFNKFFAPFLCAHVTPKAISSSGRQIAYSYIRAKGCNAFGFTDPQKIGSGTDAKWRCQVELHGNVLAWYESQNEAVARRQCFKFVAELVRFGADITKGIACTCRQAGQVTQAGTGGVEELGDDD